MRNYHQILLSATFLILLFACLTGTVFHWDFYEQQENRKLAELPDFKQTPLDGWPLAFEDYFDDHFGFRNTFIRRYNKLMRKFKKGGKVIYGNEGWLFFNAPIIMDDYLGKFQPDRERLEMDTGRLASRINWLKDRDIDYLMTIVPNKTSIYRDKMPRLLGELKQATHREMLLEHIGDRFGNHLLDLKPVIMKAKPVGDLYFKTDTHWNSLGAYIAYTNIIDRVSLFLPEIPPPFAFQALEPYPRDTPGDLARMTGTPEKYFMLHDGLSHPDKKTGWATTSLTNAVLLTKEHLPLIHKPPYTIHNPNGRYNAVVFHDSFTVELMEFLPYNFKNTTFIWRFSKSDLLKAVVEICEPDIVIEEVVERFLVSHEAGDCALEDEIMP
jgi:alginate O-acetyltransferase complex protein AlgJ